MSDQLLPDFDGPVQPPEQPSPRKPKPRPQRAKRPAKKKARAAPAPKAAKRVPKKRRVRKVGKHPGLAAPYKASNALPQLTPDIYRMIAEMMKLDAYERGVTIAIVQGLSGK